MSTNTVKNSHYSVVCTYAYNNQKKCKLFSRLPTALNLKVDKIEEGIIVSEPRAWSCEGHPKLVSQLAQQ